MRGLTGAQDGWASLSMGADGTPKATSTVRPDAKSNASETQAILTLTMKDWQDIVEAYGIEKGMVKHRTTGYDDEEKEGQQA